MRLRIIAAALVVAAASIAAFGATSAKAVISLPDYLSSITCSSPGPVLSGEGVEIAQGAQGETICEDVTPENVGLAVPVCIAGTSYLYLEDQDEDFDYTAADLVSDLNKTYGTVASLGACAGGVAPAPPPGIFLCYSAYQDQPGVWPKDVAEQLLKQGYWLPYAVSGDVAGGTNLGGFHLTCNIAATQSVSDSFVGGDGTVLGPDYAGSTVGLYPEVG